MNASISYTELSDFIEKKFKIRPEFASVDNKTLNINYKPSLFLPAIGIRLHIESMTKEVICLSYDCSHAASFMIAGAIIYLKELIPSGVEVKVEDKRICIYPQQLKQIEKVLKYVVLTDITFEGNMINVALSQV